MSGLKHVGRVIATGKKCLVVFRTLPGDAYTCLIVPTENLPDSYHDAIINLVTSAGGQESHEFGEILARATFPDGSTMLPALHSQGRLVAVPTNQIEMTPTANATVNLSELNQIIAEQLGVPVDELSIKPDTSKKNDDIQKMASIKDLPATDVAKTSSASVNQEEIANLTPEQQAKEYRSKADKLAKEAAQFRRMAEEIAPTKKKTKEEA